MNNDLIRIETKRIGDQEVNAVDARELHTFLESKTRFSDWIDRKIRKYGFEEGADYILLKVELNSSEPWIGGRPSADYVISLDMAKELAMVESNQKGKQARRYFIEVEKKYREERKPLADLTPEELQTRKAKAIVEMCSIVADAFKLTELPRLLYTQNELLKSHIPVPHVPQLQVVVEKNDYIYSRTDIYNQYGISVRSNKAREIRQILTEHETDSAYAALFHFEKSGHNGTYYKYNNKMLDKLKTLVRTEK